MGDAIGLPDRVEAFDVETVFAQGLLRMTDLGLLDWRWAREHKGMQEYAVTLQTGDAPLEVTVENGDNGPRLMVAPNEQYAPKTGLKQYTPDYQDVVSRLHWLVGDYLSLRAHKERQAKGQVS